MVNYIILIYVVSFIMCYCVCKYLMTHNEDGSYRPNSWTVGSRRTAISMALVPFINSYIGFLGSITIIVTSIYNIFRGPWLANLIEEIFKFYENDKEIK